MKLKLGKTYINIKVATSFYDRLVGLMGQKNINYGILFPKCNAIHTYFMKEPIDVIALDKNNTIVFKIVALPKNKIFTVDKKQNSTAILELPANSSKSLKLGDTINFEK